MDARRRTTAEQACGRQGHDYDQLNRNGDGGECRSMGDGQEGREDS